MSTARYQEIKRLVTGSTVLMVDTYHDRGQQPKKPSNGIDIDVPGLKGSDDLGVDKVTDCLIEAVQIHGMIFKLQFNVSSLISIQC